VPRSISHRCRVVVPSDRVLDQLDDGLALVSEHRVDGLDGDASFLGDKVPNWDGKGAGDRFFAATGVPTTYLLTPFHWEAFVFGLGAPQAGPDGVPPSLNPSLVGFTRVARGDPRAHAGPGLNAHVGGLDGVAPRLWVTECRVGRAR
jgi:hypothetical protein